MTAPQLRPYQVDMLDAIERSRAAGLRRLLCHASTGLGKTVTFAALLRHQGIADWLASLPPAVGCQMLVVAHREELLDQACEKIRAQNPGLMVSIEQGDRYSNGYSDVVIASIQTLAALKYRRLDRFLTRHQPRIVVVDECFPPGTLVDGRPIESLVVGDIVTAFDPETLSLSRRRVARCWRKTATSLVRVMTAVGAFVCTPTHKVWTPGGWVRAGRLMVGSMIGHHAAADTRSLSCVPRRRHLGDQAGDRSVAALRASLLLNSPSRRMGLAECVRADGRYQSALCVRADEGAQPDAASSSPRENASLASGHQAPSARPRRQWSARAAAATAVGGSARLADRGDSSDGRRLQAVPLQTRHRESSPEDRDRSRWDEPRSTREESAGRAEGCLSAWARVDRVEILESGGDGEFERLCPGGRVYDLEIEGLHTYFAGGFAVSNCHHAAAGTYRTVLARLGFLPTAVSSDNGGIEAATHDDVIEMRKALDGWDAIAPKDRLLIGVTATPNRTDAIGLGCVFQAISYSYALRAAITDGWLAPIKPWVIETAEDLDGVKTTAGDFNQKQLAEAVNKGRRNRIAVDAWKVYASDRSTLAFTVDVQHAIDLAAVFRADGIAAVPLSGETPKDERRSILADYTAGKIQVITNCMVLTEGTDLPRTGCILHAKPTKSPTLYEQMCVDAETEILTEHGWASIDDDITGVRVAAFELNDGSVYWSDASRIERPRGGEQMWGIDSPHLNLRVTGGHRMVVRTRGRRGWHIRAAEALPQECRVPLCGGDPTLPDAALTDDDVTFLGLLLTDGSLSAANGAISLFQSERYPAVIALIERTLAGMGVKHTHSVSTKPSNFGARRPLHRWTVSRGTPRSRDAHLRGWGYLGQWVSEDAKSLTPAYERLSERQTRLLIEAMYAGDGLKRVTATWEPQSLSICANRRLADQVQSLCVRRGIRCNLSTRTDRLVMLHLSLNRRDWGLTHHASDGRPIWSVVESEATERVWCVTVDTGAIIVRRHGKVAVVGNTGRGLRMFPGKENCIVLDVVDVSRRHSLQTAPVLYGLPPGINTQGDELGDLADKIDRLRERMPSMDVEAALQQRRMSIAELLDRAATFDVWTVQPLGEAAAGCAFDWIRTGEVYRLQYPWTIGDEDGSETLTVSPDMLGHWDLACTFHRKDGRGTAKQRTLGAQIATANAALLLAESFIVQSRGTVTRIVDNKANWKKRPASDKQIALLRRLRVPHNAATLTMGAAGRLINIAKARGWRR